MDLTSLFSNETDQRYKRILTAMDVFSKKGWAVPKTNKDGTASIHAAFEHMLRKITRNGEQRIGSLRTDNGSEFKSEVVKSYLGDKGIKQVFSNAYTAQSNGQVEKWNGILKRLIYMNLHKNQKYDWVEDFERLVGNYNDSWQSAIKTSANLAEKGALEDAPPPGQSDTDMGGEFGLNSKGRTLENIKKSKEGVVGNTKVVFKKGDGVRIAIDAIKRLKQRDVALQSNIDRIEWTKEIYRGAAGESIPKNGIAAPYYYLEGKYDKQELYCQELQEVDAVKR
jgi:transposase InsO family protein